MVFWLLKVGLAFFLWTVALLFYLFAGVIFLTVLRNEDNDDLNAFLVMVWPIVLGLYAIKGVIKLIMKGGN